MTKLRLYTRSMPGTFSTLAIAALLLAALAVGVGAWAEGGPAPADGDYEAIDSSFCADCHEASLHGSAFADDLSHSVHDGLDCLGCHVDKDTVPHKILGPGSPESSINHFNIHSTCGQCHKGVEADYLEGIHGRLAMRGETDAPLCTDCHCEHGILSPDDPRSPVGRTRQREVEKGIRTADG